MSIFGVNPRSAWHNSFMDDLFEEQEEIPVRYEYAPARSFQPCSQGWSFHPAYRQERRWPSYGPPLHCRQQHATGPRRVRKQKRDIEELFPIHVHHEEDDVNKNITSEKNEANLSRTFVPEDKEMVINSKESDDECEKETEKPVLHAKTNSTTANRSVTPTLHLDDNESDQDKEITDKEIKPEGEDQEADNNVAVNAEKKIASILSDLADLEAEVVLFSGSRKEKQFLTLEHKLTNKLLSLDSVSAPGTPNENEIRSERKAGVIRVQQALDTLETKVIT